jgi:hypothetical protein
LVRRQLGIHALQRIASSTSEKALMEQVEVLHNQIAKLQAAMKKGRTEAQQRVQETSSRRSAPTPSGARHSLSGSRPSSAC